MLLKREIGIVFLQKSCSFMPVHRLSKFYTLSITHKFVTLPLLISEFINSEMCLIRDYVRIECKVFSPDFTHFSRVAVFCASITVFLEISP